MRKKLTFLLISILIIILVLLSGCQRNQTPFSQTGFYFDTVITISLYDTDDFSSKHCEQLLEECFLQCDYYENLFSRTKEGSDIWNINHSGTQPVAVHPETIELLQKALMYCTETDGIVDITIAPISSLWNFSSSSLSADEAAVHKVPTDQELNALLQHVDYTKIKIDEAAQTVTLLDPEAAIDLGCIAKGYIADCLKDYLRENQVNSALINLGGNTVALSHKPDGSPFRIGVQKPFGQQNEAITVIPVDNQSLVCSGIYERYFEQDQVRYHHLLNSHTGRPETNGLASVTILSDSSAEGDILSTTCFLLGLEKGMKYVEAHEGIEAIFITENEELHYSSGLSKLGIEE